MSAGRSRLVPCRPIVIEPLLLAGGLRAPCFLVAGLFLIKVAFLQLAKSPLPIAAAPDVTSSREADALAESPTQSADNRGKPASSEACTEEATPRL